VPDAAPSVAAILLAAGHSERMGTQKALLPWGGATLLAYQLEQLAAVDAIREIIVVTGYAAERIAPIVDSGPASARIAYSRIPSRARRVNQCGLAGIDATPDPAILPVAVDQPRSAERGRSCARTPSRVRRSPRRSSTAIAATRCSSMPRCCRSCSPLTRRRSACTPSSSATRRR
jgi:CTP:molybdopterin cytidylyltransferase MocA